MYNTILSVLARDIRSEEIQVKGFGPPDEADSSPLDPRIRPVRRSFFSERPGRSIQDNQRR
ncbi:MAG: hypothetical protein EBS38_08730 [Actinobacteria bacterium]|nr:hypothetical protein [Actinomycetota bacterium]